MDLSIRVRDKGRVRYLPIPNRKFSETQYNQVLVRALKDGQSVNWLELDNRTLICFSLDNAFKSGLYNLTWNEVVRVPGFGK